MTTWAQLLADIRTDIKDTGTTKKFTDDVLYLYLKDAVRDYSQYFPMRETATLTPTLGVYTLPADFLGEEMVQCPPGTYLERRNYQPGAHYTVQGNTYHYYLDMGHLYIDGAPPGDLILEYAAVHSLPADVNDTTFTITIPIPDEELIRLYIKAKTSEQLRTNQANLDRFKQGSGTRTDNPLEPEVRDLMADYRYKINERFGGRIVFLYRQGRLPWKTGRIRRWWT